MFELTTESREAIVSRASDYLRTLMSDPLALRGQQLRGGGPVAEFEELLAERCGFPYCLAVCNATTALLVAAMAANLKDRSVLADRNAWMGSIGALDFCQAKLDIGDLEQWLSFPERRSGAIAAILVSDPPGKRHNARMVRSFCDLHDCLYIEDTDRLPGVTCPESEYSLADIQVLSFGPGKPLSLGEGGALLLRDKKIYEQALADSQHPERLARCGLPLDGRPLLNARMHPIAALVGSACLQPVNTDQSNPIAAPVQAMSECGFDISVEDQFDLPEPEPERPRSIRGHCFDCGIRYPFEGLLFMLPDDQWKSIFPEHGGNGVLCPNCTTIRSKRYEGAVALQVKIVTFESDSAARRLYRQPVQFESDSDDQL